MKLSEKRERKKTRSQKRQKRQQYDKSAVYVVRVRVRQPGDFYRGPLLRVVATEGDDELPRSAWLRSARLIDYSSTVGTRGMVSGHTVYSRPF